MIKAIDEKLANKLGLEVKEVKKFTRALAQLVKEELVEGNTVHIKGLGVFEPVTKVKPNHKIFGSDEPITLVKKSVKFRLSNNIKKELKGE